jgi:TPP-dependent pyruvate/acetoin dehydrogenase alpha subunit
MAAKAQSKLSLKRGGASATGARPTPVLDRELAHKALHYMTLMREVEDRIERKLYRQGKILGGVYVGRGQEAISVGVGLAARPDDVLFPCHRDLALYFIRGIHPRQVFAQYMGRTGGLTRGRDGNMHMGDLDRKIVAIISAMAASIPVAAGAAMALKYQGRDDVAFVLFGDGATSRGDFHEGLNMAAVQRVPLVAICNNNQYAYSTPVSKQMACDNVVDKAPGYGVPAEIVDGNDVVAVWDAASRAAAHARAGNGPYLLECKTFRMTGHSAHDPADYVPPEMFDEWRERDPIGCLRARMFDEKLATPAELDALHAALLAEVDESIAWAEACPYPDPSTLHDGVYGDR